FQNDVGNFQAAKICFNRAVEIKPSFAAAHWNRSAHSTNIEADLKAVKKLIASNDVAQNDTHYLHFTAYRYCEKLELCDEAFEHLQIANAMKRRTFDYDLGAELAIDKNAKAVFNIELMQDLETPDKSDLQPIFIMGMPRSGTTLVEQIIASHSKVAGGDEYTALANATMQAQRQSNFNGQVDQWLASRGTDDWQKIGRLYEHNMRFVCGDKKIFTDKNQFNHRSIGIIKASLANAKIIVLDRSPMDVAFGCYRQLFGGQGAKFSYQLDEIAKLYASYMDLIDYWESVTDGLILRVQYENLVQDQQSVTDQILQFCQLEPQHQCFEFYKTERTVKTLSASQVRQPIFTQGIDRWKKYQRQLQPMVRELETAGLLEH
ncbi:MAG: sulfotransferase, partial [Arenicella sp.]|nr:sulfotransferase [Arenicella sp.]